MLQKQFELEEAHHKNQLLPKLIESSKDITEDEFIQNLLAQMVIHRRASVATLVGLLKRFGDTLQEVADKLYKAAEEDWVDYDGNEFIVKFMPNQEFLNETDMLMYPLPSLVPPAAVLSNKDSGYYTKYSEHMSCLTGERHQGDICLEIVNQQNSIPLTRNKHIVENANLYLKGIHGEKNSFKRRMKLAQFNKFINQGKQMLDKLEEVSETLYLTHYYDNRGRLYCRGYHFSYQSFEWMKATVELANKEVITDEII